MPGRVPLLPSVRIFMRRPLFRTSSSTNTTSQRFLIATCIASTAAGLAAVPAGAGVVVPTASVGSLAHAAAGVSTGLATMTPSDPQDASAAATTAATTAKAGADQAAAAVTSAATGLEAAMASYSVAETAVSAAATGIDGAHAALQAARTELAVATERAEEAARHREAAVETLDLLRAGAMQTIDPGTLIASGLSLIDQIDPAVDREEELRDARIRAERAIAIDEIRQAELGAVGERELEAASQVQVATFAEVSAADALDTAADGRDAATHAKSVAEQTLASAEKEAQDASVAAARALAAAQSARSMDRPAISQVTSPYGMRTHPITGVYKLHSGTDFSVGDGVARAARAGTVSEVTLDGAYGNMVTVAHGTIDGDDVVTRYAHLARATVSVGDSVAAGDTVGDIGSTGYATGPHLHFEVLVNGEFVDPMGWLDN